MSIWNAFGASVLSFSNGYHRRRLGSAPSFPSVFALLGTLFGVGTAHAACPITPDQVAVYVDANLQGSCRVLDPGFYGGPAAFGLPDNSISSVAVGDNVNVTLFTNAQSGTWKFNESSSTFFGSGYTVTNVGSGFNDKASAIEVASRIDGATSTARVAHWFLGDNPTRFRGQAWAAQAQGLAHDSDNWYITNTQHIYKYPLTASLTGSPTLSVGIPSELSALNCNHFGDPDVAVSPQGEPFLFVPVEGCSGSPFGVSELVAVFDTSLNLVTFDALYAPEQAGHASWLAFQPTPDGQALLFSSNYERIGANDPLIRYELNWSAVFPDPAGHYILFGNSNLFLTNESPDGPSFVDIAHVQGGVFSDDGSVLYLSNGASLTSQFTCPSSRDGNGVHAFRTTDFQRIAQSSNGFGGFNFANKPCSITALEEVEGIDFVNMWDRGGAFNGFLHAMMISNVNNSVYLKHFNQ